MTETKIQARNVLCVLHDTPTTIRELCDEFPSFEYDEEFSGQGHDTRMSEAFAISDDTVQPTLTDADKNAISNHRDVAYVLSSRLNASDGIEEARRALTFVDRCFRSGARAIKCESSGLTHGKHKWQELAERQDDASLFLAWVRRPLDDDGVIYSCGLHLLGYPDIEVVGETVSAALEMIDIFAMYVLVDRPGDRLRVGNTFCVSADSPVYRISSSQCLRYEDDDFFYNPHGYWHLEQV